MEPRTDCVSPPATFRCLGEMRRALRGDPAPRSGASAQAGPLPGELEPFAPGRRARHPSVSSRAINKMAFVRALQNGDLLKAFRIHTYSESSVASTRHAKPNPRPNQTTARHGPQSPSPLSVPPTSRATSPRSRGCCLTSPGPESPFVQVLPVARDRALTLPARSSRSLGRRTEPGLVRSVVTHVGSTPSETLF